MDNKFAQMSSVILTPPEKPKTPTRILTKGAEQLQISYITPTQECTFTEIWGQHSEVGN